MGSNKNDLSVSLIHLQLHHLKVIHCNVKDFLDYLREISITWLNENETKK